ncbi:histone-lysine N-methyltransferase SETMAR [Trichonephila clavata]|uniref:Histone-lysine N-methyltransferase SETMAR n=1 Tax=Trichonephila clavata TaxID=2740835 RepID=A0A8X6L1H9_TRICU|nr:histone-lysine N-methyltransferase SETMAR [Trichonephila clavata]
MHRRMKAVYSEYSLCHSSIVEWHKRFLEGLELPEDDARPERAHRVITPEMIAGENVLVLDNRRIIVNEIHRLLGISGSTTHTIMHQHFNFRKIHTQWVPHQMTAEQHNTRMAQSSSHLQACRHKFSLVTKHGVTSLNRKTSVRASNGNVRLNHLQRNQKEKMAVHTSSGKVMMSFSDHKGPLLVFLERGASINAQHYQATLQNLIRAIKSKGLGMLSVALFSCMIIPTHTRPMR